MNQGINSDAFFKNIDWIDVGAAGIEGFVTSGTSAIKNASVKAGVRVATTVVSSALSNTLNVTATNGLSINSTQEAISRTVSESFVGSIPFSGKKLNIFSQKSNNQVVKAARAAAHAKGNGLSAQEAKAIAKKNVVKKEAAKSINNAISDVVSSQESTITTKIANHIDTFILKQIEQEYEQKK